MGIQALLSMTLFYIVKYFAYFAVIMVAVVLGKKWADHGKKKIPVENTEE